MRREEKLKNITTGAATVGIIAIVVWLNFHVPILGKLLAFFLPVIMAYAGLKTNYRTFYIMVIVSTFSMYLVVTDPLYPISRGIISFLIESLPLIWCIRQKLSQIIIVGLLSITLIIHWLLDLLIIQFITRISIHSSIIKMANEVSLILHFFHFHLPGNPFLFISFIIAIFIIRAALVAVIYTSTTTVLLARVK